MHVKVVSLVHCRTGSVGCMLKWFLLCTRTGSVGCMLKWFLLCTVGQGLLDAC